MTMNETGTHAQTLAHNANPDGCEHGPESICAAVCVDCNVGHWGPDFHGWDFPSPNHWTPGLLGKVSSGHDYVAEPDIAADGVWWWTCPLEPSDSGHGPFRNSEEAMAAADLAHLKIDNDAGNLDNDCVNGVRKSDLIALLEDIPGDPVVTVYAEANQADWYHHISQVQRPGPVDGDGPMTIIINLGRAWDTREA